MIYWIRYILVDWWNIMSLKLRLWWFRLWETDHEWKERERKNREQCISEFVFESESERRGVYSQSSEVVVILQALHTPQSIVTQVPENEISWILSYKTYAQIHTAGWMLSSEYTLKEYRRSNMLQIVMLKMLRLWAPVFEFELECNILTNSKIGSAVFVIL